MYGMHLGIFFCMVRLDSKKSWANDMIWCSMHQKWPEDLLEDIDAFHGQEVVASLNMVSWRYVSMPHRVVCAEANVICMAEVGSLKCCPMKGRAKAKKIAKRSEKTPLQLGAHIVQSHIVHENSSSSIAHEISNQKPALTLSLFFFPSLLKKPLSYVARCPHRGRLDLSSWFFNLNYNWMAMANFIFFDPELDLPPQCGQEMSLIGCFHPIRHWHRSNIGPPCCFCCFFTTLWGM